MTHTEVWSWFDAPELSDVDLSEHSVTAVLVCRNASSWLNATLAGIGQLDHRPDIIIAVDNESSDDTAELLHDAYAAGLVDAVLRGKAGASFGQSVERAMAMIESPTRWIWLLHDDAVPDHDALTELLDLAARTPKLAIAIPLLVRPARRNHAARTLEIGATISGSGRRNLGLEPDEVAQGQYESTSVLGGSTCGMLVRWESLVELGGFDRCISAYRDGVDIGWRAHLIDQWVLTCPKARIIHRQAGRSEIRKATIAQRSGRSEASWDRLMGLRLVAAHARGFERLTILFRLTFVCLFSALAYLLGRAPDRAKDEVQAWADFLFRSRKPVARLRKIIRKISAGKDTKVRVSSLRPTFGNVLDETFQGFIRWFQAQWSFGSDAGMTLDDLLGDEFTRRLGEGRRKVPFLVWFGLLVGGIIIMVRGLVRTGMVTAPTLLGTPETVAIAFQRALSAHGLSEPWLLLAAAGSALTLNPEWLPVVVLTLAFPVIMVVGAWFARHRIERVGIRWFAAAGYATLVIAMGGLNRGAMWLVMLAIVLPFIAEWISRIPQPWMGARSLQTVAGIALSGVLMYAISPALWAPAVVVALAVAIRTGGFARIVRVFIAALLPVGFWAQSIPALLREPARAFLTPEAMITPESLTWQMLFARPTDVGLPPQWLSLAAFGCLWVGVLVVLITGTWRRWLALSGVLLIAGAMWCTHLTLNLSGLAVHPDPSALLFIAFALLLYSVVSWIDHTLNSLEGRDFGGMHALIAFLSLLLMSSFLLGIGWGAYAGMSEVSRGPNGVVPEYLAYNEIEFDTGTLIINATNRTWNLRYSGQTYWGQGSFLDGVVGNEAASAIVEQIVARALAGRSDDTITNELATFGVSSVVVLRPNPETVAALDTTAGFQRTTSGGDTEIWAVTVQGASPTRRALITEGAPPLFLGSHDDVPRDAARNLVFALPVDPSLKVFVGDLELRATGSGDWRAAYALGAASGEIRFEHVIDNTWAAWVQLGLFILFVIFVFPPLTDSSVSDEEVKTQTRRARS
ncbi:MAG: glycosyltransferase family 2 protein [Propionibacteriaceae bacterium]|nr:glycosyltransferase family 2 protein [Propionibacteriaceae bacterium]